MKFKVGDRVVGNKKANAIYGITREGWQGVVVRVREGNHIVVEANPGMHTGRFDVCDEYFDLLSTGYGVQKILVTTNGIKTTARMYRGKELVKSAEATCSPDDKFDFETGAALAVDRLLGRAAKDEAPKPFPLEDIEAGYLIELKRDGVREHFHMTVVPGNDGALACSDGDANWWPMAEFDEGLRYEEDQIVAVYGYARSRRLLENSPDGRQLLWSRSGKVK